MLENENTKYLAIGVTITKDLKKGIIISAMCALKPIGPLFLYEICFLAPKM